MPDAPRFNLIMLYQAGLFDPNDYVAIADRIKIHAPDMLVHILPDMRQQDWVYNKLAELPCLSFCPTPIQKFRPPRGRIFCGQRIPKSRQMQLMAKGGVRVPQWTIYSPHQIYSETEWGRFVIVKPDRFAYASGGRDVKLVRTTALASQALAAVTSRARRHMIVQRFLDTGTYSQDYRMVTLFGNPLYALKRKSLIALPDLEQTEADTLVNGVVSNSTAGEREVHYCYDKDVLDFAKTVYRAIPEVPLQALDVRRDRNDGRLYCLEINPGGYTWNFSSRRAKATPTIDGIRREDQLGAWEIAAKALIEQTRLHAS
jgi:hypothetical protein